jgi:hypothetical protein
MVKAKLAMVKLMFMVKVEFATAQAELFALRMAAR